MQENLPNLSSHFLDLESGFFKGVELLEGWVLSKECTSKVSNKTVKTYTWSERSVEDSLIEGEAFLKDLIGSLENRLNSGVNEACSSLHECLDFTYLLSHVIGSRESSGLPYDVRVLAIEQEERSFLNS